MMVMYIMIYYFDGNDVDGAGYYDVDYNGDDSVDVNDLLF
jgi:hypothetical protein